MNHPSQKEPSRAAGGSPVFNIGLSAGDPPAPPLCETNPICPTPTIRRPKKCETNPISTRPTTRIRETNPIPANGGPDFTKRTQFPNALIKANSLCINSLDKIGDGYMFRHPTRTQMRNKPNLPQAKLPILPRWPKVSQSLSRPVGGAPGTQFPANLSTGKDLRQKLARG